jgi:hypothetical protein
MFNLTQARVRKRLAGITGHHVIQRLQFFCRAACGDEVSRIVLVFKARNAVGLAASSRVSACFV